MNKIDYVNWWYIVYFSNYLSMWQKIDPRGHRVWVMKSRPCERFSSSKNQSAQFFVEDIKIRELIESFYFRAAIAKVVIRKSDEDGEILIFTAKPAAILGIDNAMLHKFEGKLSKVTSKKLKIIVKEVKKPELSAKIMAEFACMQLENRMSYRRVAKSVLQKVMEKWAIWVKVQIAWRLWWAEMSRNEKFTEGRIPLQTLRADIDYHYTTAHTKYWVLWVKVWICVSENIRVTKKVNAMDKI